MDRSTADMQQRLIRRILRVNHAGEHGAIAIYSAQIGLARRFSSSLLSWLDATLLHEQRHRELFQNSMPERHAKPCRALFVWSVGGMLLGTATALLGQFGIVVCTAAVERIVHRHLVEQISYLESHDEALAQTVRDILKDEDAHLAFAEERHNPQSLFARLLSAIVSAATELLIWISTRGDSMHLSVTLRKAAAQPLPR
jgi:ubiquinone biosynthesis monooxygenase Coq7